MLKEVRQKLKLLSSTAVNTAALMQAVTADFKHETAHGVVSDEDNEGEMVKEHQRAVTNEKKARKQAPRLKIATKG